MGAEKPLAAPLAAMSLTLPHHVVVIPRTPSVMLPALVAQRQPSRLYAVPIAGRAPTGPLGDASVGRGQRLALESSGRRIAQELRCRPPQGPSRHLYGGRRAPSSLAGSDCTRTAPNAQRGRRRTASRTTHEQHGRLPLRRPVRSRHLRQLGTATQLRRAYRSRIWAQRFPLVPNKLKRDIVARQQS